MSSFSKIAPMLVLSLSLACAGAGCMADAADDEPTEDQSTPTAAVEQTGESADALITPCGPGLPWFFGLLGFGCGVTTAPWIDTRGL